MNICLCAFELVFIYAELEYTLSTKGKSTILKVNKIPKHY